MLQEEKDEEDDLAETGGRKRRSHEAGGRSAKRARAVHGYVNGDDEDDSDSAPIRRRGESPVSVPTLLVYVIGIRVHGYTDRDVDGKSEDEPIRRAQGYNNKTSLQVSLLCRAWNLWLLWQAVPDRSSWLPAASDVHTVHRQRGGRQGRRGGSLIVLAVNRGVQHWSSEGH